MSFNIEDYVTFDSKGRAICPSCQQLKGSSFRKRNLSLMGSGAYKCFAGCDPKDIRNALGAAKPGIIPTAIAQQTIAPKSVTVSPEKVKAAHQALRDANGAVEARTWLAARGINLSLMERHQLGITRAKCGDRHLPAITIPLPNADGTAYYQKKRIAPWLSEAERPPEYKPWSQAGIPVRHFFTYKPLAPEQTWLCEGEWDAIVLGQLCWEAAANVAVATFTCGAGVVPPQEQLDELPGETVVVFYDRNDKPLPNGDRPGEAGARKIVSALGSRGRVGMVPMPDGCDVAGWDVTNAIQHGYQFADFVAAAAAAGQLDGDQPKQKENPLKARLLTTDQLVEQAPEFVEWLVPDLLTADELFVLGSPPRGGKSLMCMLLAKSVATGQPFLDRPVTRGSVLYVNMEDSEAKIRERIEAQRWTQGLPVYWLDKFKLSEIPHLIDLAGDIPSLRLIVLDTLSRVRDGDISESAAEMSQVLEPLQEFAKAQKVCILLVHHTRKLNVDDQQIEAVFDSLRGSSAIRGTCRGMLIIAPAENNSYRLAAENGWGKHDLRIRLNLELLEWQLLGKWNPIINLDQKGLALDFLNKVGSATIDTISEETGIPKRSLYTVLDRLIRDSMIEKTGSQRSAVYIRPVQQVQQLNSLLNCQKEEPTDDRDEVQQKNNSFFPDSEVISDHQNVHECYKTHSNPVSDKISAPMITLPPNDHLSRESNFVEEGEGQPSNPVSEIVSAVQQEFNRSSTVELELGDKVEILVGQFLGKRALVKGFEDSGEVIVKADRWYVTRSYKPSDLRLLKRGAVSYE